MFEDFSWIVPQRQVQKEELREDVKGLFEVEHLLLREVLEVLFLIFVLVLLMVVP